MKTHICIITLIFLSKMLFTQVFNLNPDPNGDPQWAGGLPEKTPEIQAEINSYPLLVLSTASGNTVLPDKFDNSARKFMRPIFPQSTGSCGQAAGIGYAFTYEINRLRDSSAISNEQNQYPTHFTYNFLNKADPNFGSWPYQGWEILRDNGCPTSYIYGGLYLYNNAEEPMVMPYIWKTGYDVYSSGFSNRVKSIYRIDGTADSGLMILKHWLNNHNEGGESIGGVACFSTYIKPGYGVAYNKLPLDSDFFDEWIMTSVSEVDSGYHSMTIVGYNDDIKYDFDSSGTYSDNEIGAFKVANSSRLNWMNSGYIWVPYRFLDDEDWMLDIMVIEAEDYTPELAYKVKIQNECRNKLSIRLGYAVYASDPEPDYSKHKRLSIMMRQGGELAMQGITEDDEEHDTLEVMFDFGHIYKDSSFYIKNEFGKLFLHIIDKGENGVYGSILDYSMVDYRWNESFELDCEDDPLIVTENSLRHFSYFIDYDLLPHSKQGKEIDSTLNIHSNMVSRFISTVSNNSTLTVEDGVKIDMYDSEIEINSGSELVLEDSSVFIAKRGNCKITIDGNITIGDNVTFKAEEGATLVVLLNNNDLVAIFDNSTFENCKLRSYAKSLQITDSEFNDCNTVFSYRGNVNISYTDFVNTCLYLVDQTSGQVSTAAIDHCTFANDYAFNPQNTYAAIDICNYGNFLINADSIAGYYAGIFVAQSGGGSAGYHKIINNEIYNLNTTGITIFNSTATIETNHIYNNECGIRLNNNSTVDLTGIPNAQSYSEMNYIRDNSSFELYSSAGSFPWYFKYNAIIDEDNGSSNDEMVYSEPPGGSILFDVEYNCWTESNNFSASEDLYPSGYDVIPMYCPPGGGHKSSELALEDFQEGMEYFENEEFEDAKASFENVIETYPVTQYASASMKELLELEKFLDNDYSTLQTYFETNDSIQADSVLYKLAIFLGNKCEIEMENWQTAIDHFEDVIENPDTPEDSIFAIIDLGYTYFLMENSESRSIAQGQMLEHKPNNFEAFAEKRDYLLSLLPFKKSNDKPETEIDGQSQNKVFQNVPNPFTNSTTVYYNLTASSGVIFKIYDNMGKEVKLIDAATQPKGQHKVEIDMKGFPKGIYFYSMYVNGQLEDSKKMVVK